MLNKIVKYNKLIASVLVLTFLLSLGMPAWSDEANPTESEPTEASTPAEDEVIEGMEPLSSRQCEDPFGCRTQSEPCEAGGECGKLFEQMRKVAESTTLELYVLESYTYTGFDEADVQLPVRDSTGAVRLFDDGEEVSRTGVPFTGVEILLYDENGRPTTNAVGQDRITSNVPPGGRGALSRPARVNPADYGIESDEPTVTIHYYTGLEFTDVDRTMEAGIFAVRNKSNGFLWWSNPINASQDPVAGNRPVQLSMLSSPLAISAANPASPGGGTSFFTNTARSSGIESVIDTIEIHGRDSSAPANGVRFNYHFERRSTRISLEVVLENDNILVTIPHDRLIEEDITSDEGSVLLAMSLLSSFGAGSENNGYIVVPDGSGAVINFNNAKTTTPIYAGQVYGRDFAVSQRRAAPITQQVHLPVFGIVRNGGANALVAVAEKGAENALIRAAVAGQGANNTSLNVAWFDFTLRTADSFFIGTNNTSIPIFETGHIRTGDISVRYFPISAPVNERGRPIAGEELTYVDVALKYRDYLANANNTFPHTSVGSNAATVSTPPFYMTLNGGTVKTHSIAGFPVELQTAATTYSQAQIMVERLRAAGVNNAVITYNDFNTAGIRRQVGTNVHYSNLLGGKKNYRNLSNSVSQSGYSLYPAIDFMTFYRDGRGYNFLQHSAREATRSRAALEHHELAFGTPDTFRDTWSILSPAFYERAMNSIGRSLKSEGITTVSLDNATSMIYSDFSRSNPFEYANTGFNRRDSVQLLTEGFRKLNADGISIKASTSANAYALPYVTHISNVPMYSSAFDLFDYDIPFYQIAISGLVPYTTRPFNASADLNQLVLLSLVTGTPLHYEFVYENPSEFTDSDYNTLFYAHYDSWIDESLEMYDFFNKVIGSVVNQTIVSHVRDPNRMVDGVLRTPDLPTEPHIHETKFADGTVIRVNLQTYQVWLNAQEIDTSTLRRGE